MIRAFAIVSLLFIACSCDNEPFGQPTLGVSAFVDETASITETFTYSGSRLYKYTKTTSGTVNSSMKFSYRGSKLTEILSDSSTTGYKLTLFYDGDVDSTFLIQGTTRTALSRRLVEYGADGRPTSVTISTFGSSPSTTSVQLEWTEDNVTRQVLYSHNAGQKTVVQELAISQDDQISPFANGTEYVYVLPLASMYWLSKNNPLVFSDAAGQRTYTYWYNKFGYRSNFKTNTDVLFGVSYTRIR